MSYDYLESIFGLSGRVALVTGAAGGIGSVLCNALGRVGAEVVLADRDLEGAQLAAGRVASRSAAEPYALDLDLCSESSIKQAVNVVAQRSERIDILVNCAAVNRRQPILEVQQDTFDSILNVNLRGAFLLAREVVPVMIRNGGGKIINVGSINSEFGLSGVSVYGASKGAIKQLTMVMAVEWAEHNIQVNCLAPGFMHTPLSDPLWEIEEKRSWMLGRIAQRRSGEPAELVGALLLLASSASSYMTGQTIIVDGGVCAGGTSW